MPRFHPAVPVIRNYRISHIAEVIGDCVRDPVRRTRAMAIYRHFDAAGLLTVPVQQMLELLENVAEAAGLDDLGLRVGARYHPADWGAYGYLFLNSPTVLQALKSWVRVTQEEQQGAHARLSLVDNGIRLEYAVLQPADVRRRQDAEMTLAVLLQAVRVVAGAATAPLAVHFEHPRPRHPAPHSAYFRAPLHFGMGVNAIVFDRRLAATSIPNADSRLLGVISEFLGRERVSSPQATTLPDLVKFALRPLLPSGTPSLSAVSRQLGMSGRSIQRRLAETGQSFDGCLASLRQALAQEMLQSPDLEIKEIAFLLGYSGSAALSRAFRQWVGVPPQSWRSALQTPPRKAPRKDRRAG